MTEQYRDSFGVMCDVPEGYWSPTWQYTSIREGALRYAWNESMMRVVIREYDEINTEEAHMADDYHDPNTPLNLVRKKYDAANAARQDAYDDLVITCATMAQRDIRLATKVHDKNLESYVKYEEYKRIMEGK